MRKFQLTSPNFKGHVEAIYTAEGILSIIDMSNAELNQQGIAKMKFTMPPLMVDINNAFASTTVIVVEVDYPVTFQMFMDAYKKKVRRVRAEAIWNKLSKLDQIKAINGIKKYDSYLLRVSWRTKADPDTYLKQEYWNDEWDKLNN